MSIDFKKFSSKEYAAFMKIAKEKTGAEFFADAHDDSGMEYYIEAFYRGSDNNRKVAKIHCQNLGL